MRSLRPRWRLAMTLTAISLAAVIFTFPNSTEAAERVIRRGSIGDASTLDPHLWIDGWEGNIVMDLFQGLTTLDPAAKVIPGAAESWTVSKDGRIYTFKLRAATTWSDGVPLDAGDFVYSFRRIVDPATASPAATFLYDIRNAKQVHAGEKPPETLGVSAPDPLTVRIELLHPTPYFPELIVHRALPAPRHAIEKHGRLWTRPGNMVSNDAFILDSWVVQDHVRLAKNERFYAADKVELDAIYHIPIEDHRTGLNRFRAGELDILVTIPPAQLNWVRENLGDLLHLVPSIGLDYYVFNLRRKPFDDVRVRKALSMAIDRRVITDKVLQAGEPPAHTLMPPGILNYPQKAYVDFKDTPMPERLAGARELLGAAGYGPSNPLGLTLHYNTSEKHRRVAVAMASMWKRLGVRTELYNSENKVLVSNIRSRDFDVARSSWFAEVRDPMTYLELLHSESGSINQSGYHNPRFDALVDRARDTVDLQERAGLMRQAEAIALADQAIMPINFYIGKRLVQARVRGWVDNVRGIHRARYFSVVD